MGLELSIISGCVDKDTYVSIFRYCLHAASVTGWSVLRLNEEHPSGVIWMHADIWVGIISSQALCKFVDLHLFTVFLVKCQKL